MKIKVGHIFYQRHFGLSYITKINKRTIHYMDRYGRCWRYVRDFISTSGHLYTDIFEEE